VGVVVAVQSENFLVIIRVKPSFENETCAIL